MDYLPRRDARTLGTLSHEWGGVRSFQGIELLNHRICREFFSIRVFSPHMIGKSISAGCIEFGEGFSAPVDGGAGATSWFDNR